VANLRMTHLCRWISGLGVPIHKTRDEMQAPLFSWGSRISTLYMSISCTTGTTCQTLRSAASHPPTDARRKKGIVK